MKGLKQNPANSCDATKLKQFAEEFKYLYRILDEYGEKKILHSEIQSYTQPQIKLSTVRGYCARPESIPEKNRAFFIRLLGESLNRMIEKKQTSSRQFIAELELHKKNLVKHVQSLTHHVNN